MTSVAFEASVVSPRPAKGSALTERASGPTGMGEDSGFAAMVESEAGGQPKPADTPAVQALSPTAVQGVQAPTSDAAQIVQIPLPEATKPAEGVPALNALLLPETAAAAEVKAETPHIMPDEIVTEATAASGQKADETPVAPAMVAAAPPAPVPAIAASMPAPPVPEAVTQTTEPAEATAPASAVPSTPAPATADLSKPAADALRTPAQAAATPKPRAAATPHAETPPEVAETETTEAKAPELQAARPQQQAPAQPAPARADASAQNAAQSDNTAARADDAASTAKPNVDPAPQLAQFTAPAHSATTQAAPSQSAPVSAAQPVPVNALAFEIAGQARAGNSRFEIRLDPPELGRIDVRLDVDRDGNVTSRLVIERADTYDLLRRDQSTLERALQQAGLKTSDNALEFSLRDQGFAQRQDSDDRPRGGRAIIQDTETTSGEAANGYARLIAARGGIDIRV